MFNNLDPATTRILEEGMRAQRQGIPEEERCRNCDGMGQVAMGCAITHTIYNTCYHCHGSGRRDKDLEKFLEEQEERNKK